MLKKSIIKIFAMVLIFCFTFIVGCSKSKDSKKTNEQNSMFESEVFYDEEFGNIQYSLGEDGKTRIGILPSINVFSCVDQFTKEYSDVAISVSNCEKEYEISNVLAQFKVRGNGTSKETKKPYRIKFNKKQKMLGLNDDLEAKSWVLLAEYIDPSFLRNATALSLAKNILGVDSYYSSDYRHVELFINGIYQGVYLLAEQQQVNSGRVNINEAKSGNKSLEIGYLIELDKYYEPEEYWFEVEYKDLIAYNDELLDKSLFEPHFTIKSDINCVEQADFIAEYIQNVFDVVYDAVYNNHDDLQTSPYKTTDDKYEIVDDTTIASAREAASRLIDINSLVDTMLLQELVQNHDLGWSSFYMSIDFSETGNGLLTFQAPWDFDLSLLCEQDVEVLFTCNRMHGLFTIEDNVNPWFVLLCKEDWYWDIAKEKYQKFRCNDCAGGGVEESINQIDKISDYFANDFKKDFSLWHAESSYDQKVAANKIKDYLRRRVEFFDKFFGFINDENISQNE